MSKTFLYFAYGSNLLSKRIHMNCPGAVRKGCGKLQNYCLNFNKFSNRWKGCSATIVPCKGELVWGAIWEIDADKMPILDRVEGVDQKIYFPIEADITTQKGIIQKCRFYQQIKLPVIEKNIANLPDERKPSGTYLDVIIQGAKESNLPEYYQEYLKSIPHNDYIGPVELDLPLDE